MTNVVSNESTTLGGIVLCGGRSQRMGAPKEWLCVDGETLLSRVVRVLSGVVQPVVVAARAGQKTPPLPNGTQLVQDRLQDRGPLAGLESGFAALDGNCGAALVVACDHPNVQAGFLERLAELLDGRNAVVPLIDGQMYPLTAAYRLAMRARLTQYLREDGRAVRGFARCCDAYFAGPHDFADVDPQLFSLQNLNEMQDFQRFVNPADPTVSAT